MPSGAGRPPPNPYETYEFEWVLPFVLGLVIGVALTLWATSR